MIGLAREVDRRNAPVIHNPFESQTPFEQLLAGD
jgi:hypothetical protein